MSNPWFVVPFLIGTAAFFATLYVTMFVPNMSDTPWQEQDPEEVHPLRRWDTVITWLMWVRILTALATVSSSLSRSDQRVRGVLLCDF